MDPEHKMNLVKNAVGRKNNAKAVVDVFMQSRTLKSVKLAKDKIISSQNILKVPIEYEIGHLKPQKSDASKLICAVRNFYKH